MWCLPELLISDARYGWKNEVLNLNDIYSSRQLFNLLNTLDLYCHVSKASAPKKIGQNERNSCAFILPKINGSWNSYNTFESESVFINCHNGELIVLAYPHANSIRMQIHYLISSLGLYPHITNETLPNKSIQNRSIIFSKGKGHPSGRTFQSVRLRPLACWDCGLESRRVYGCLLWVLCAVR
jgi:hypothetical protein